MKTHKSKRILFTRWVQCDHAVSLQHASNCEKSETKSMQRQKLIEPLPFKISDSPTFNLKELQLGQNFTGKGTGTTGCILGLLLHPSRWWVVPSEETLLGAEWLQSSSTAYCNQRKWKFWIAARLSFPVLCLNLHQLRSFHKKTTSTLYIWPPLLYSNCYCRNAEYAVIKFQ